MMLILYKICANVLYNIINLIVQLYKQYANGSLSNRICSKAAFRIPINSPPSAIILYCPNGGYNRKTLLQSLITNQGPLNGSYETYWPFNAENTPRLAGWLTVSRANFLVNCFVLRNIRCQIFTNVAYKIILHSLQ